MFASRSCRAESSGESSRASRLVSAGPIQDKGGFLSSARKSSVTITDTPMHHGLIRPPSVSSKTPVSIASLVSKRSQAFGKSAIAAP